MSWTALHIACWVPATIYFLFTRFWPKRPHLDGVPVDPENRKLYFQTYQTIVTAAGLALALLGATLKNTHFDGTEFLVSHAAAWLFACLVSAVATLLAMSALYELSRQRDAAHDLQKIPVQQELLINGTNDALEKLLTYAKGLELKDEQTAGLAKECAEIREKVSKGVEKYEYGVHKGEMFFIATPAWFSLGSFLVGFTYVLQLLLGFGSGSANVTETVTRYTSPVRGAAAAAAQCPSQIPTESGVPDRSYGQGGFIELPVSRSPR